MRPVSSKRLALLVVSLAVGYLAGASAAYAATNVLVDGVSLFAPAGMTVAAFALTWRRQWLPLIGVIVVAEGAMDLAHGYPLPLVAGFVAANVAHPVVTASLLRFPGRHFDPAGPPVFQSPATLVRFLLIAATAGPACSAAIGATTLALGGVGAPFWGALVHWYLGDLYGAVIIATALLAIVARPEHLQVVPSNLAERIGLQLLLAVVLLASYLTGSQPLSWAVLPIVLWIAMRGGLRNSGVALLVCTLIAEAATATGRGVIFKAVGSRPDALDLLQGYLVVALLCTMLLAVETTRRHRLQALLAETEHDALQGELLRSRRVESIGQMAAGLAHDFNNLVGVIRNYSEHLGLDPTLSPGSRHDVEQLHRTAVRGGDLVQRLLQLSRAEEHQLEDVDLGELVQGLADVLQVPFARHVLQVDATPGVVVHGDRVRLEQVVLNLLVNARDATSPGDTITVRVGVADVGAGALLEVRDDGSGMRAEVAARAFEPFFSTKAGNDGRGVGLATVRQIVQQHGGTIELRSRVGAGTTVSVQLPSAHGGPTTDGGTGRGEVILVVDDDPTARRAATRLLRQQGYATVALASASAALDALAGGVLPDLVLSDVLMAELTGIELADLLHRAHPGLPVVLMSGEIAAADRELPWPVLPKPLDPDSLADALGRALARRSGAIDRGARDDEPVNA